MTVKMKLEQFQPSKKAIRLHYKLCKVLSEYKMQDCGDALTLLLAMYMIEETKDFYETKKKCEHFLPKLLATVITLYEEYGRTIPSEFYAPSTDSRNLQ